jgi:hypothetical protein
MGVDDVVTELELDVLDLDFHVDLGVDLALVIDFIVELRVDLGSYVGVGFELIFEQVGFSCFRNGVLLDFARSPRRADHVRFASSDPRG